MLHTDAPAEADRVGAYATAAIVKYSGATKSNHGWRGCSTRLSQLLPIVFLCSPIWSMPKKNKRGNVRINITLRRVHVTIIAVE
jgi:hypothetical protein